MSQYFLISLLSPGCGFLFYASFFSLRLGVLLIISHMDKPAGLDFSTIPENSLILGQLFPAAGYKNLVRALLLTPYL